MLVSKMWNQRGEEVVILLVLSEQKLCAARNRLLHNPWVFDLISKVDLYSY